MVAFEEKLEASTQKDRNLRLLSTSRQYHLVSYLSMLSVTISPLW